MNTQAFNAAAQQWITGFDQGAQRAIAGWREGADRVGSYARGRWDRAFAESSPQLSAETRRNASHFRDVVARNYARGVELSTQGAGRAVATLVDAARSAAGGRMAR